MTDGKPRPIAAALRLLWPLALVLAAMLAVSALVAGTLAWLLGSEGGTRWLAAHVPGLQAEGVRGALLGEHFEADRVTYSWSEKGHVTITALVGEGLEGRWRPGRRSWLALDIAKLSARSVVVVSGAQPGGPPHGVPNALRLPVRIRVDAVSCDELLIDALAPFTAISGAVDLGGPVHRARGVHATWEKLRMQGDASIRGARPFEIEGRIEAVPADTAPGAAPAFAAVLAAQGELEALALDTTLRGVPLAGRPAPSGDLHVLWKPWQGWPFPELSARTEALDLAALSARWPETRLTGSAHADRSAPDAPITVQARFDNAQPGRWNEGRLPLRQVALDVRAQPGAHDRVGIDAFDLLFAGTQAAGASAGRIRGKGEWNRDTLTLDTRLEGLRPNEIDGRGPAMTLSGPLALVLHGVPSPAAGQAPSGAKAPAALSAAVRATLEGQLDAAPQPVSLAIEAEADATRFQIKQAHAGAGRAQADFQAAGRRSNGEWQIDTSGSLADFDPRPWWPGAPASWAAGPHRLNASWQLGLSVPAAARLAQPLGPRVALDGRAALRDSVLAGVPVSADLAFTHPPGGPATLHGELHAGPNRLALEGSGDPVGSGSADRLQIELEAPQLAALAPLLRLAPQTAAFTPSAGSASAKVEALGRWPEVGTTGQASLEGVAVEGLLVGQGQAQWHLDLRGDGTHPLQLQAQLADMQWGRQRAKLLRAELRGSLREHELTIEGALPLVPPAWAEQAFGVQALAGTRVRLEGTGTWQRRAGGSTWQGHVEELAVGSWDGKTLDAGTAAPPAAAASQPAPPASAASAAGPANWLLARGIDARLDLDAAGKPQRLRADAGRLNLGSAVWLRWNEVDLDLADDSLSRLALRGEIEPFAVAPLLARAQPNVRWSGDLTLRGRLDIKAAERFDADLVLERSGGDLAAATEDEEPAALGLAQLRLALAAHGGEWRFSQALSGTRLGELAGEQRVLTAPALRWPAPDAPVQGRIEANVADLGLWVHWLPAGWRLAGRLQTDAAVGGRFGALEYTGHLSARDVGVSNVLQGVNVSQGQVDVKLEGPTATVERFTARGGEGTLTLTGGAEFGSAPVAHLQLQAQRFHVLGRVDRSLTMSGQGSMEADLKRVVVSGSFEVDEGLFDASSSDAPSLDDDVTVRRAVAAPEPDAGFVVQRPHREIAAEIDVDLGSRLRVRGRGLDTLLQGRLHIATPGDKLAINGTVNTRDGTYAAYAQKLEIERGVVAFSGAPDNPRLDILALRPNLDVRVGVFIGGTLQAPRVQLYSDPEMSDTDKLSWLMLGREPDGLDRNDTLMLQRAAVALLAGEGEAPTDALIHALGLDELSFKQSDTDVRETVVSLGKQLSRRWYLGYERGVNATTGTWQLIYRLAQRLTVRAQSGEENSLDIIWTWRLAAKAQAEAAAAAAAAAASAPASAPVRKSGPGNPP